MKNYPVGCVATAMAQIMKYNRKPEQYRWDNMPDLTNHNIPYVDVANLLLDIGIAVDMNYDEVGSGTKNKNAEKAFRSYGYADAILIDHDDFTARTNLSDLHPVYMSGIEADIKIGHAWVCDGVRETHLKTAFYLMILYENDGNYSYIPHEVMVEKESSYRLFHMNWGYNGRANGWFRDENIEFHLPPGENKDRNYSIGRKDIINLY